MRCSLILKTTYNCLVTSATGLGQDRGEMKLSPIMKTTYNRLLMSATGLG